MAVDIDYLDTNGRDAILDAGLGRTFYCRVGGKLRQRSGTAACGPAHGEHTNPFTGTAAWQPTVPKARRRSRPHAGACAPCRLSPARLPRRSYRWWLLWLAEATAAGLLSLMREMTADISPRTEIGRAPDLMQGLVEDRLDIGVIYTPRRPDLELEMPPDETPALVSAGRASPSQPTAGYVYVDRRPECSNTHARRCGGGDGENGALSVAAQKLDEPLITARAIRDQMSQSNFPASGCLIQSSNDPYAIDHVASTQHLRCHSTSRMPCRRWLRPKPGLTLVRYRPGPSHQGSISIVLVPALGMSTPLIAHECRWRKLRTVPPK